MYSFTFDQSSPLATWILLAKKQRVVDGAKVLDVAKESADWFPPLKSALDGVNALIKHFEVSIGRVDVVQSWHGLPQQFEDVEEKVEELLPQLDRFKHHDNGRWRPRKDGSTQGVECVLAPVDYRADRSRQSSQYISGNRRNIPEIVGKEYHDSVHGQGGGSKMRATLIERLREAIVCYRVANHCVLVSGIIATRGVDIATKDNPPSNRSSHGRSSC